ncbi:hypothetical protein [Roseateles microcysteis]|uniref:hypothetical protein n=1 Tax=Roseateles microcysteis TaxID=3119057 RepID=UPI002FE6A8AB
MTVAAREVLEDCRGAVDEIGGGVQGRAWRRRWVAAVVLMRTVGYVLAAVDSKRSPAHKAAIDKAWAALSATKPEPAIFWSFIDMERHSIVHEYDIGAGQGVTVSPGAAIPVEHHYVMNSGPYAGKDQREVLRDCIGWWESYLDAIEREVGK